MNALAEFLTIADQLYRDYRIRGPGTLDRQRLESLVAAHRLFDDVTISDELRLAIDDIVGLAEKCVLDPQGLCFLSGEAGLVPRQDLHTKFENALDTIRNQ